MKPAAKKMPHQPKSFKPTAPKEELPDDKYERPEYEQPDDEYEQPMDEYERPDDEYEPPDDECEQPDDEYEQPYDEYEYEQPDDEYERPDDEYTQPDDEYKQPYGEYEQPDDEYERPDDEYTQPDDEYTQPDDEYTQPDDQVLMGPVPPQNPPSLMQLFLTPDSKLRCLMNVSAGPINLHQATQLWWMEQVCNMPMNELTRCIVAAHQLGTSYESFAAFSMRMRWQRMNHSEFIMPTD